MLSFLAKHPSRTRVAHLSKITFDDGRSSIEFKAPSNRYLVINRLPPASIQEHPGNDNDSNPTPTPPNCALNPPMHWHSKQDEFFHVLEGQATFYLGGRRKVAVAGDVVVIPGGQFHTFRNASHRDELVVEFVLEPRDRGRDEQFFSTGLTLFFLSFGRTLTTVADAVSYCREHTDLSRRLPQSWNAAEPVPGLALQPTRKRRPRLARARVHCKADGSAAQPCGGHGGEMDLWLPGLLCRILCRRKSSSSLMQASDKRPRSADEMRTLLDIPQHICRPRSEIRRACADGRMQGPGKPP